jgi:DNA-binding NtrC family response regulator
LTAVAETDFACERTDWAAFRPERLQTCTADLVVFVAAPETRHAEPTFEWLKTHPISSPTLAVLPDDGRLLQAAAGAVDDFVVWPVREGEWRQRVLRLVAPESGDRAELNERLAAEMGLMRLVGREPGFVRTVARIPLLARSGSPVLITGETGTGKELCARAIHHLGPRRSFPFIPVDCGGVPDHLFENEVFGHARGAFTDAHGDQKGMVAMADGGTLFLDEIDALPPVVQSKLLRFLQERTFKPLGSDRFVRADVNVLAATNRDLEALVREKRFRPDLYFRLNVLSLHLDPLRRRRRDVPLLARHFADAICAEQKVPAKTLSLPVLRKLTLHDWPGNVRELYNAMRRAVVFAEGGSIRVCHVQLDGSGGELSEESETSSFRQARVRAVEMFEQTFVEELMRRHDGNVTRAAREAQKERRSFGRLVKKYGLQHGERTS